MNAYSTELQHQVREIRVFNRTRGIGIHACMSFYHGRPPRHTGTQGLQVKISGVK
jgi:hypothetical protein